VAKKFNCERETRGGGRKKEREREEIEENKAAYTIYVATLAVWLSSADSVCLLKKV
jgi:hypothetical protein